MALHPLHRAWRALPAGPRRRALNAGTAWLAPRPERPAPSCRLGVAVAGELGRDSGIGEGARLMLAGLRAVGVPCWEAGPGHEVPPEGVPLVVHANAAALPLAMLRLGRGLVRGRRVIGVWPWELAVVPEGWRQGFGFVHEVWAPSRFSAASVALVMPAWCSVRVVPHCVAAQAMPAAMDRAALGLPEGAVVTLVAFDLASSFVRKNPLGAIAAHRLAFGGRADRVLLLRVGHAAAFPEDFAAILEAVAGLGNVVVDVEARSRKAAHAVMAACDIVLSLHRSEGFGLVPAEGMLLGKAVVATAWSGTEDFLDDRWACRVPARMVAAVDPRGVFAAEGAMWAEPDIEAAAGMLRRLADDPAARLRMGDAARAAAGERLGPGLLGEAVRGLGIEPLGIEPLGIEPLGIEPLGIEPDR